MFIDGINVTYDKYWKYKSRNILVISFEFIFQSLFKTTEKYYQKSSIWSP